MPLRLCIPWLLVLAAVGAWSATAWGQPPRGARRGFSFDQMLQRHDKDEDGKVTRKEWQGPEHIFGMIDQNKDGTVTKKEFEARMKARGGFGAARGGAGGPPPKIDGPSVVKGQKAGIEVGQYAPDFELQPIESYPKLREWLGAGAPESIEEKVKLSQLVGKRPILLLYGSYT